MPCNFFLFSTFSSSLSSLLCVPIHHPSHSPPPAGQSLFSLSDRFAYSIPPPVPSLHLKHYTSSYPTSHTPSLHLLYPSFVFSIHKYIYIISSSLSLQFTTTFHLS